MWFSCHHVAVVLQGGCGVKNGVFPGSLSPLIYGLSRVNATLNYDFFILPLNHSVVSFLFSYLLLLLLGRLRPHFYGEMKLAVTGSAAATSPEKKRRENDIKMRGKGDKK